MEKVESFNSWAVPSGKLKNISNCWLSLLRGTRISIQIFKPKKKIKTQKGDLKPVAAGSRDAVLPCLAAWTSVSCPQRALQHPWLPSLNSQAAFGLLSSNLRVYSWHEGLLSLGILRVFAFNLGSWSLCLPVPLNIINIQKLSMALLLFMWIIIHFYLYGY